MQVKTILHPTPPYDFNLSFGYLGPNCPDPIAYFDGNVYERIWPFGADRNAHVRLQSIGTTDNPELLLNLEAPEITDDDVECCMQHIRDILCLDLDIEAFYDGLKADPILTKHCLKNRGLKPVLEPNLFEALTWAIIGQQVNLNFACQVKSGMLERFAKRWDLDGKVFYQCPEASDLAGKNPDHWREFKCSRRKAEYIIGLAEHIQNGFDLDDLRQQPDEEIVESLVQIRGIGRWTAEYVLIQGFGRWDALPVGDAGLQNGVKKVYGLKTKPTEEELVIMAENWRPYRGLATYYLWWGK